ncbi:MAG: phage tail protein [Pseudohongiellaceae bacterium]
MESFLGAIQLFPYTFAPQGWSLCDGRLLEISTEPALFSLLGVQFGGDGRVSFALPDLRGKEPHPNTQYYIATHGLYPARE